MTNICKKCLKFGIHELCRVDSNRGVEYKDKCMNGTSELREKIFAFLFNLRRGAQVDIINDEQRMHIEEFIELHGFNEGVVLKDENTVKKYKFINQDYESNSKREERKARD